MAQSESHQSDLIRELRKLHHCGVWNALQADFPQLASEVVRLHGAAQDGRPFGTSLALAIEVALPKLSVGDQAAVRLLFGLSPYEHLGPRKRHERLPSVAHRTWSQFRGSPFDRLGERLLEALFAEAGTEFAADSGLGFYLRELSQTYIEPTHGSPLPSISEVREVVATVDQLSQWTTIHRLQMRSAIAPPVIQFVGERGSLTHTLVKLDDQDGDGFSVELRVEFDEPLRLGESCTFSVNKTIAVNVDEYHAAPGARFTGFEGIPRIDRLKLRVQFDPTRDQPVVHKVSGSSVAEYSSITAASPFVTQLETKSCIEVHWDTPTRYRWYGLRWE